MKAWLWSTGSQIKRTIGIRLEPGPICDDKAFNENLWKISLFTQWVCLHNECVYTMSVFTQWVCLHNECVYTGIYLTLHCIGKEGDSDKSFLGR